MTQHVGRRRRTACRPAVGAACRAGGSRRPPRRSPPLRTSSVASRHAGAQRPFWFTATRMPRSARALEHGGQGGELVGVDRSAASGRARACLRRPRARSSPAGPPVAVAMSTMRPRVGQQLVDGRRRRARRTGSARGSSRSRVRGRGSTRRRRPRRTARRRAGAPTGRSCPRRGSPRRRGRRGSCGAGRAAVSVIGASSRGAASKRSTAWSMSGSPRSRRLEGAATSPASTTSVTSRATSTRPAATWLHDDA